MLRADGRGVVLRDELTGGTREVAARAVVNATGVWAGDLDADVTLRPSRGTHLVLRAETLPGLRTAVTAPVPGSTSRFVLVLPQPDGTVYVGLTDEPVEGPVPDVPVPTEPEIGFLLDVVSAAFAHDLRRDDVVGAFAGLRPLLDADGTTADLSRRHAVLSSRSGVVTVVGGKLTTYRRMAEDAVDRAVSDAGLVGRALPHPVAAAARCRTPRRPRGCSSTTHDWSAASAPRRAWCSTPPARPPGSPTTSCWRPLAEHLPATLAELVFGVTHEAAVDVDDLLDRRTRIGLVPADRALAAPAAERALALVGHRLPHHR